MFKGFKGNFNVNQVKIIRVFHHGKKKQLGHINIQGFLAFDNEKPWESNKIKTTKGNKPRIKENFWGSPT